MTKGALLRIEVREKNRQCQLVFRAGGRKVPILCQIRWDQIAEIRAIIRNALEEFQNAIGEGLDLINWPLIDAALAELDKTGNSLLYRIFGPSNTKDLYEFLRKRAPLLLSSQSGGPIPIVELDSSADYIHFEALPLLGVGGRNKVTGEKTLRRTMRRFLGMSSIIRRTSLKPPSQDLRLRKDNKLPIKFFRDPSLPGAAIEADFFKRWAQHFDLDGPWPRGRVSVDRFTQRLAAYLTKPNRTFAGARREPVDQIHHISCHCYIGEELSQNNRLEFSYGSNSYCATLRDLQAAYSEIYRSLRKQRASPPLVFLNACTSVSVDVNELCSFPTLLLDSHRGVIGTETRIPDTVAAEFSQAFYRALLSGKTVGESLHLAKWHLLNEHKNPLGLVYTLYADPNLRVS